MKAKILLQRCWEQKLNWDDPLPSAIQDAWYNWRSELHLLAEKRISHCYFDKSSQITSLVLHGFCDDSEHAYAAVVYLRITNSLGNTSYSGEQNTSVGNEEQKVAVPILLGITISILVSLYAPLTQAVYNPALDIGPRAFAACVGWGRIAFPGPRTGFWVYIVGPVIGGLVGALVYDCIVAQVVKLARKSKRKALEGQ